jgi:hypothetical protein
METITLKMPDEELRETSRQAASLKVPRAVYIRMAISLMNKRTEARLRAERLAEVSKRVRAESMTVNSEFAAIERDPDA